MPGLVTLEGLLAVGADSATAITAPGRVPLTYRELRQHTRDAIATLNGLGIGRQDRVVIVLSNGPEMATAFLAIAGGATAAPLNPGYREAEFAFYLEDLKARAIVIEAGSDSAAIGAAARLGVEIIELHARLDAPAGVFDLLAREGQPAAAPPARGGFAEADDTALILHTSGTTSRPKIVPLSQSNICASVSAIVATLSLSAADCGLLIMPMFHIHGLIAGLLAPLAAGGRVFCPPGFNALRFFGWFAEASPTWYTAVPTMHQAIAARAPRNLDVIAANPLRFVRSSSAAMPPQVMQDLEAVFAAPLIESYGMTEASHQMASNPLPPSPRKAGTVGVGAGPDVAIMDEAGRLLGANAVGEVVIRGPGVTAGYENNEAANAGAFTAGWFRTGDQGVIDADGYLTITGRLKEIINRGGEKISPREVDEVLLDHPAVEQATTFALPHDKLGEEVAAAIVLRDGMQATERDLRDFAAGRLVDFKVPRRIVIVPEIPKGPTGKVQRIGLAEKLGLDQSTTQDSRR